MPRDSDSHTSPEWTNWENGCFLYGTEFKTSPELIRDAILNGFKGIDTAAQPRNCHEDAVGAGIAQAIACSECKLKREDIWIQTKFTPLGAQPLNGMLPLNMPYNPKDTLEKMVESSIQSSLRRLGVDQLDALLLHEPLHTIDDTMRAWTTMEKFVPDTIRYLGISNIDLSTLRQLHERATIKPSIVQSRFRLVRSSTQESYGFQLRQFCKENRILYQPFLILKANPHLLKSKLVCNLADYFGVTVEQMLYSLVGSLGGHICILNGTTQTKRMKHDVEAVRKVGRVPEEVVKQFEDFLRYSSECIQNSVEQRT
jgi:diketogulonate reductase-like aldo/keto reductase